MKRRTTLIGFTEAELGFIVAAVVAFVAANPSAGNSDSRKGSHEDESTAAVWQIAQVDTSEGQIVSSDTTRSRPVPDSISRRKVRDCSEIGLPRYPLPLIVVLDSFTYKMRDVVL